MLQVGVQLANEIAEASVSEFEKMFKVNVTGTFLVTRALSAIMKTQDPIPVDEAVPARGVARGSIVNLGSASGFVATPGMVQYTAAKHAVNGVTKNAGKCLCFVGVNGLGSGSSRGYLEVSGGLNWRWG